MGLTFKDLQNFVTTASSRTLSEASEKLEMAQPSLSLGIKKLEEQLGMTLFIRTREGLKLTPQGSKLLPDAQEALHLLDRIQGKSTALKFRIGCHPSVGMYILGNFLRNIHAIEPRINFEIVNGPSSEINKLTAQGAVDFGLVMNPTPVQGLISKTIGSDEVYVWESTDRYQDKLIFNPQMLQCHSILSRWKDAPSDRIDVQNLELICSLAASGAGMAILPSQVVKALHLSLKKVPQTPAFKDQLALVCYPEMIKSKEGKMIFEALKKSFQGPA